MVLGKFAVSYNRYDRHSHCPVHAPCSVALSGCSSSFPTTSVCISVLRALSPSVQSFSQVQLFATPWIAARQASLSITNSQSLHKLMSITSVKPSNYLILCHPLLLPPSIFSASGSFPMSQFFASGAQSIGVSPSASVSLFHQEVSISLLPLSIRGQTE